jgi:AcrR family transcriptional regulator
MAEATEARRAQRRAAAARAGYARLAMEGFPEARLESLASDAGLTRPALLFYFEDRAELLAEAATCAAEDACGVLARRVQGEEGAAAIRGLRRGLDELAAVLPDAFAVLLDAPGACPRTTVSQQARGEAAHARLLAALVQGIAGPRGDREGARKLAQMAWLSLLGAHREARAHARSGLALRPVLPADLDFTEGQLVALVQAFRQRR